MNKSENGTRLFKKLRALLQNQMRMYKQLVFCESSCIEIMITCQCCKVVDVFRENKYSPNVNDPDEFNLQVFKYTFHIGNPESSVKQYWQVLDIAQRYL